MQTKSLYERLGGYDAIAAVTDDLLARLLNDPQLGVFWKGHSENSLRRDRQLVVNYMCEAAGGPVFYTGRDMQTSVEGIWAVGDVRAQLTKQIATAVGDGTTAAVSASNYVTSLKDAARA